MEDLTEGLDRRDLPIVLGITHTSDAVHLSMLGVLRLRHSSPGLRRVEATLNEVDPVECSP